MWVYADYALEGVQRIAELAEADVIKIDPGQVGTIETSFVERGVPAITLEVGPANNWNGTLIQRAVDFVFRLMDDLEMTSGETPTPDLSNTYVANNFSDVAVAYSGWVELDVGMMDDVTEGQIVGRVYNSWGDVLQELNSTVNGRVLTHLVDPAVEAGAGVLTIAYNATSDSA
jgi:predicted deacylase